LKKEFVEKISSEEKNHEFLGDTINMDKQHAYPISLIDSFFKTYRDEGRKISRRDLNSKTVFFLSLVFSKN